MTNLIIKLYIFKTHISSLKNAYHIKNKNKNHQNHLILPTKPKT